MNLRKRSHFFSIGLLGVWLVAVAALALATPATGSAASKPEAWEQRQGGTLIIGSSKDMNTKHPYTRVTSVDEYIKSDDVGTNRHVRPRRQPARHPGRELGTQRRRHRVDFPACGAASSSTMEPK